VALVGSLTFQETIAERTNEMLLPSLGRLGKVLKNRGFTLLLLLFSLGAVSTFAFIASSTYIYQDDFHLSGQVYSFFFSVNALGMIAGPMIFLWFSQRVHTERIILGCYISTLISGLLVCFLGSREPWIFALCILPASIAGSCLRPGSANRCWNSRRGIRVRFPR
jgi:MFS transporter, DHA1 family, multidrug resistance protein